MQSEDFLYRIRYFNVDGYFESEEKVSGLSSNPEKFGVNVA